MSQRIVQENGVFYCKKEVSPEDIQVLLSEATNAVEGELNEIERFRAEIVKYSQVIASYETSIRSRLADMGITEEFLQMSRNYFPAEAAKFGF